MFKSIVFLTVLVFANTSPVQELRLIKTVENEPASWMTQEEIWSLIRDHKNFADITGHEFPQGKQANTKAIPTQIRYQSVVNSLLPSISASRIESFIRSLSTYTTRYYESNTGLQSEKWLLSEVQNAVQQSSRASVAEFSHSWLQPSIIAKIEGSDPILKNEVVIIGAHQDSISLVGPTQPAPGADDNASGSALVLEVLRILVASSFVPKRTIEFHWYAAEEVGLRGSADIARSYSNAGVDVVAMINFDVSGYHAPGRNNVGIFTDNVSTQLNQFLRLVVNEYLEYGWENRQCGYGCSDHVSWNNYQFPAAFPSEVVFHPQMHSTGDTLQNMDVQQVVQFVKLALSSTVEIAEPQ